MFSYLKSPKAKVILLGVFFLAMTASWLYFYDFRDVDGVTREAATYDQFNDSKIEQEAQIDEERRGLLPQVRNNDQESVTGTDFVVVESRPVINASPSTIYPNDPLEHYRAHIEDAIDGDADAQYEVVRALEECRSARSISREDLLGELLLKTSVTQELRELVLSKHDICSSLVTEVGDVRAQITAWVGRAYESGHPVIETRAAIDAWAQARGDEYLVQANNFRESLGASLATRQPESLLQVSIYLVNVFSHDFIEEREAWGYLVCKSNPTCSTVEHKKDLYDRVAQQYADSSIKLAAEYEDALSKGAFSVSQIPEPQPQPPKPNHVLN